MKERKSIKDIARILRTIEDIVLYPSRGFSGERFVNNHKH